MHLVPLWTLFQGLKDKVVKYDFSFNLSNAHIFFHLQPPESRSDTQQKAQDTQNSTKSSKEDQTVPKDDYEQVKEESQSWKQKFQAKSGENSFLRKELSKLQSQLENGKREHLKVLDLKSEEKKQLEEVTKSKLDGLKSEKLFMQRELDEMTEKLQRFQRTYCNGDSNVNKNSRFRSPEMNLPPAKKPKMTKIPSNIDESLFLDTPKKTLSTSISTPSVSTVHSVRFYLILFLSKFF